MSTTSNQSRLYGQIIEESSDGVLFADRRGVIRVWNSGAERMFGIAAEEAIGQSLDLIIPENLRSRHWEGYFRVMESGDTKYRTGLLTSPGMRRDGSRISLEFSMSVVRDDNGEVVGCASILRDVTTRWQKEKEMRERLKSLEESGR
ncbi:MAG TPA: PAS domain S-box protein [Geobacteraceae bacterium]|nr:PAS domain S-box protein [Geobacteraceae bacterium]